MQTQEEHVKSKDKSLHFFLLTGAQKHEADSFWFSPLT